MDERKTIYLDDAMDAIRKDMHADMDYMSAIICDGIEDVLNSLPSAHPNLKGAKFEIICSQRQTGRTTKLIEKCARYRYALIVCPGRMRASHIFHYARKMGKHIPMPMTFGDFLQGRFAAEHIDAFLIDDLDSCLANYSKNVPIDTVVFEGRAEE